MANDGKIIIETGLDTSGIKKDLQAVGNVVEKDLGQNITKTMDKAETSIKKMGKAVSGVDFTNIKSQMDNITKSIDNTNSKIEVQKTKLAGLKTAFESATNVKAKNKIQEQMESTEKTIVNLESKLSTLGTRLGSLNSKFDISKSKNAMADLDGEFKTASASITKSIDKIENKAKTMDASLSTNLSKTGDNISKVGNKISSVGDKLTMGVTIPLVGIGVAGAKVGMDFDSAMSRVKAISGATGDEFNKLKGQAIQLGADTAFSAKEAASGMENLASAGFTTKQIMVAMPGMLDLAASSGEDLASSADIAASTLNGFGLAADQAGHVADVLAKNASATNAAVKDTGEAMKYISPVAQEAGWSLESVTAAIGEMANSGIKGSSSGTTLRSMFTSLVKPSKEAADAMQAMGFKAYDSNHKMKSLSGLITDLDKATAKMTTQQKENTIATLFGQEAMSGILTLIKNGSSGLDDLTNSYKNSDGAAKEMAKTMQDNAKSSIEQMVGSMETAAIKVEETFAPKITELANYVGDLADKFAELTPEQQEFYLKLAAGAMALGPVTKGIGTLTTGIGGLIKFGGGIAKVLGPAAAAEGALGEGAAVTTGLLGGLGVAGGVALAAVLALGVGVAGVVTHNELMSKSLVTSTDDLNAWEKIINDLTGNTIKSKEELQEAGLEYRKFGNNIGKDFQKKVEESTKAIGEFSLFLSNINFDEVLTDSETSEFNKRVNDLCTEAIETIKARQKETQTEMSKLFMSDDNALDDNEKQTLEALNAQGEEQIKKVTENQKSIQEIYTNGIKERGYLNDEEKAAIKQRYTEIARLELEASQEAKNKYEKDYAKNEFTNRANNLSAEDGSKLLKDQKSKLDEQRIKDAATYDTQLDQLNELLATQSGKEAEATQATINKFTEKKNKVAELEKEQWLECIATLEKQNPKLVGVYNKYTGDILSTKDKEKAGVLQTMQDTYTGMNSITKEGMYSLYNTSSGTMEDVYVSIDKTTGDIVAAYGTTSGYIGGYTEQMSKDTQKTAQEMATAYGKVKQNLDTATSASVNAAGEMVDQNGRVISKLGELQTAEDGTFYRIMDLNGTPIKIETNAEGTSVDLDKVKESADNIPLGKKVTTETNAAETGQEVDTLGKKVNNIPEHHQTFFEALFKGQGWDYIEKLLGIGGSVKADTNIDNNYTGTNGGESGLSFVNEIDHGGWEISSGANEIAMLGSGSKITNHMTSVDQMNQEISTQVGNSIGKFVNILSNAMGIQSNLLNQVAKNTFDTVANGKDSIQLNKKMANDLVDKFNSKDGEFSELQNELTSSKAASDKASNMKIEDNKWYFDSKSRLDDVQAKIDAMKDSIDETEDKKYKESLQKQQKTLEKQKDSIQKEVDYYKDAAQKEIEICKDNAKKQVDIANEKKERLTKLAEATTNAIKAKLEEEKTQADKVITDRMKKEETAYNAKISMIDKETKRKTDSIDEEIKALEEQSQIETREEERKAAKDNINMLRTKMANTKSQADKDALALQIKNAQKELNKKEDSWNIEDEKAKLEEEKNTLAERATAKKDSLKKEYEDQKASEEAKLKATDEYYSKLMETESLNSQARYILLTKSNNDLVNLLNSYAPNWQNAGQSLADSLLTGLNSSKQSVQDAVNEMVSFRGQQAPSTYYDASSGKMVGYESGTSYNPKSGYYKVDEKGFETTNSGSVAYVSKGAAINNNMQSMKAIKKLTSEEVAKQVSLMRSSVMQMQMQTQALSNVTNSTNNSKIYNDYGIKFNVENLHNYDTKTDIKDISNELGSYQQQQRKF